MKKLLSITCVIFLFSFLTSCSSLLPKRFVRDDNVFYSSSSPATEIKICDEFEYSEMNEQSQCAFETRGGTSSSEIKTEVFYFKHKKDESRFLFVTINTIITPNWRFLSSPLDCSSALECGSADIHGDTYQYAVYIENGPQTFLIKPYAKFVGAANNGILSISYIEKVKGNWSNVKNLSEEKKAKLKEFNESCAKAFQIIK